jgi:hypothetical protein
MVTGFTTHLVVKLEELMDCEECKSSSTSTSLCDFEIAWVISS